MGNPKIIEVSYGLASNYGDTIEMNRNLVGDLKDKVTKHELRHGRNRKYGLRDIKNDFASKNSYFKDSIFFCIRNPSAWIGFFPSLYSYYFREWTFNWSAVLPFLYFGIIFSLFWWLIFKVSVLQSFICYSLVIILINIILLVITHRIVKNSGYQY
jgi:hypothetical protein